MCHDKNTTIRPCLAHCFDTSNYAPGNPQGFPFVNKVKTEEIQKKNTSRDIIKKFVGLYAKHTAKWSLCV